MEIRAAARWFRGKIVVSRAVAARIWATTLTKMPMEQRALPKASALGPYSLDTIWSRVVQPLRRRGTTKAMARIRQPMPEPRVNHQADIP